jgi:hypothetical protein
MAKFSIHPWAKIGSLKNVTVMDLTAELSNMKIENDLQREVQENIRRLRDMGTYRGRRHAMGLPVSQVGVVAQSECDVVLTMVDHNGAATEQGGKRWLRQSTAMRWAARIIVSYCSSAHAYYGVYDTESRSQHCAHFVQRFTSLN